MKGAIDGGEGNNQQARFTCNRRAATSPHAAARSEPPRHQRHQEMQDGKARPPGASWFEDGNGACAAHGRPARQAGMALRAVRTPGGRLPRAQRSVPRASLPVGISLPAPGGAGSRAATKRRMRRHAFCSGTPPRSDRGCGGLRSPAPVGAGSRAATKRRMRRHAFCSVPKCRMPRIGHAPGTTPHCSNARNATSSITLTPRARALSSFEPASVPATT